MPPRGKSRKNTRSRAATGPLISRAAALRFSQGFLWLLALAAAGYGLTRLEPLAAQRYADPEVFPTRLIWQNVPSWLLDGPHADVLADLEGQLAAAGADQHPLPPDLLGRVHQIVSASPWVTEVQRVTRQADHTLHVYAEFRAPLTHVIHDDYAYLISRGGVQLEPGVPSDYLPVSGALPIAGVRPPPPGLGERWADPALTAGLKLAARLLYEEQRGALPYRRLLDSIDVRAFDELAAGPLHLRITGSDVYILWGKPPGQEYETEASATEKLAKLLRAYNQEQGFRVLRDVIDVRDRDTILHRPRPTP